MNSMEQIDDKNKYKKLIHSNYFEEDISELSISELKKTQSVLNSQLQLLKVISKAIISSAILIGSLISMITYLLDYNALNIFQYISSTKTIWVFLFIVFAVSWTIILERWKSGQYSSKLNSLLKKKRSLEADSRVKKDSVKKSYIETLVSMNNTKLEEYYNQVRENNQNLLNAGIIVGLLGFFVVVCSLSLGAAFKGEIEIVTLSTISGLFIDTFAGAFFVQYGLSSKNMKDYFESLVRTQEKLIALHSRNENIEES